MISSAITAIVSTPNSATISSNTDSTPEIDTGNLLYEDDDGIVNALYEDDDGIGKALFEEII